MANIKRVECLFPNRQIMEVPVGKTLREGENGYRLKILSTIGDNSYRGVGGKRGCRRSLEGEQRIIRI